LNHKTTCSDKSKTDPITHFALRLLWVRPCEAQGNRTRGTMTAPRKGARPK